MSEVAAERLVYTRPELIELTGSKDLVDTAVRTRALAVIRVGRKGSRRPRLLFRREDVAAWLEALAKQEEA